MQPVVRGGGRTWAFEQLAEAEARYVALVRQGADPSGLWLEVVEPCPRCEAERQRADGPEVRGAIRAGQVLGAVIGAAIALHGATARPGVPSATQAGDAAWIGPLVWVFVLASWALAGALVGAMVGASLVEVRAARGASHGPHEHFRLHLAEGADQSPK